MSQIRMTPEVCWISSPSMPLLNTGSSLLVLTIADLLNQFGSSRSSSIKPERAFSLRQTASMSPLAEPSLLL